MVLMRSCYWQSYYPHHTVVWGVLSLLCVCHFVCLFVCHFVWLRISQRRKKLGAWNIACVLAYYPDRSSPLLVKFGSRRFTGAALLSWMYAAAGGRPTGPAILAPAARVDGHWELRRRRCLKMICNNFLVVKLNCLSAVYNIMKSILLLRNVKNTTILEKEH